MNRFTKHMALATTLALCFVVAMPATLFAQEDQRYTEKELRTLGIYFVESEADVICTPSSGSTSASTGGINNIDYAGNPILNETQLTRINENRPTYEKAANQVDIPWQMIAVIHLRETGLKRANPANGQGVYQFVNGDGGPYPTGEITDEEFLNQTIFMATKIKEDYSQRTRLEQNKILSATNSSPDAVKDTFFSYNGRSSKYALQAVALGFDRLTQPFEGSPYVMNKADANRDPAVNQTTWGQIKTDGGPIVYPANNDYGAFVVYAALSGLGTSGSSCGTQAQGGTIIEIARRELAGGANFNDGTYLKYTGGVEAQWCAYFVSWVLNEAGTPFADGTIATAEGVMAYGRDRNIWHPKDELGFIPQPGDIAVYKENLDPYPSHVNFVVAVDVASGTYTTIGGNEGDGTGNFTVVEATHSLTLPALTGYVRLP